MAYPISKQPAHRFGAYLIHDIMGNEMLNKQNNWRNKKYRAGAKGQCCIRCGGQDETIVLAHYQGIGAIRLGKGRGIKPHDFAGADLCQECHNWFDSYEAENSDSRAMEFLLLCMLTIERRINDGYEIRQ